MRHTIKDIAKLANVSRGTVDRVLHKRGKVAKEALERVNKILKEIDYKPNQFAQSLKGSKVNKIAVQIPDPSQDQYWTKCWEGLQAAAKEFESFGISTEEYFYSPTNPSSFKETADRLLIQRPDAVLMVPLFYNEAELFLEKCEDEKIPVVAINTPIPKRDSQYFIGQDLYQSGRVAADLIFQFCQEPCKLIVLHVDENPEYSVHLQEKEQGFRDYFESHSDISIQVLQTSNKDDGQLSDMLSEVLGGKVAVMGIFVTTSKVFKMVKIFDVLQYKGALVGYDLIDENLKYLKEGKINFLINQSPETQGYLGIRFLTEYFSFNKKIPQEKYLPIDIVSRENFRFYI